MSHMNVLKIVNACMIMSVIHMAAPQGEKDGNSWQEVLSAGYCLWK